MAILAIPVKELVFGCLLALPLALALIISSRAKINLPRVGHSPGLLNWKVWQARYGFYQHNEDLIKESYAKHKDGACTLHSLVRDHVVVGPKYMEQLRTLPESQLSASGALVDSVLGQYNGVDINLKDNLSGDMVRGPFTRVLPDVFPSMVDELNRVLRNNFGDKARVELSAYDTMYSMINQVVSRVFIGAPMCYDKRWTFAVEELPSNVFAVMGSLFFLPEFVRPWVAPLLPAKKRLAQNLDGVRNLLFPNGHIVELTKDHVTAFKLLSQASKNKDSQEELSQRILLLTAAAMHTSCTAAVNVLFDLCLMPDYIATLRTEALAAVAKTQGEWKFETIKNMPRMDSFLKESQRVNPSNLLAFGRKVMAPVTLPDGKTMLRPGDSIRAAGSEMARDATYYTDPEKFDGDRFYNLSVKDPQSREFEYAGIENGNLTWGTGRFTCPGRWYASTMLKLVIGKIVSEYDVGFPEPLTRRPEEEKIDTRVTPNKSQKIIFTRR